MVNQIFRLKDILYNIRKRMSVIVSMTAGGLLIGILFYMVQSFSLSDQNMYKVFVSLSLGTSNEEGNYTNNMISPGQFDFELASSLVDWVTYIVRSEKVCKEAVERLNLIGVTTKSVQNALSVTPYGKTSIMELTLLWPDSDEGVQIMETIMGILPVAMREVLNIGDINRIEGPVVTTVSTPVGKSTIFLFPVMGLLGGLLYCFAQMYMHPTLIDIKDVGELFGINTLAVIDDDPSFEEFLRENLITNRQALSSLMKDNYTTFAHILLHQIDDEYFSLYVTSSVYGEGKTTVVANLGIALAAMDKRVLLIDFDLSSPNLGGYFMDDIPYKNTVNAVYFDDVSVEDALVRVSPNLYLLMASLDNRYISIDRFAKKLVSQLEVEFDVVILDTPPLGENSDTLYFNSVSRNALYVIRYDYAGCDVITENIEKLNKAGTSLMGAIINRVPIKTRQASQNKAESEVRAERGASSRKKLLGKLPFAKDKSSGKAKLRAGTGNADEIDSFDSDEDLIDTEDFAQYLNSVHLGQEPPSPQAAAARRKRAAILSDDNDDERIERMEAAMGEAEALGGDAPAPEDGQPVKKKRKRLRRGLSRRADAPEQAEEAPPEDEDEDARLERLFSTHVNHLDGNDEDRL